MSRFFAIAIGALFQLCALYSQEETLFHYTVNDGLPSSHVYYGMQDSKGYLWFGTDKGLCRFDGYEFKTYTVADGLPFNDVWRLMEDSKGRIWISTFGPDFYYFEKESFVRIKNPYESSRESPIYKVTEDQKGNYWIQTAAHIYWCENDRIKKRSVLKEFLDQNWTQEYTPKDFIVGGNSIWAIENDSIFFYRSVAFFESPLSVFRTDVSSPKYLPLNEFHSLDTSVHFYKNHLYFSLKDSLVDLEFVVNHCTNYPRPIRGTEDYIFKCDTSILAVGKNLDLTKDYDFLGQFDVHMIFLDKQKNLWIPTDDKGVFMRPANSIYTKNYKGIEGEFAVKSLVKSGDGALWIGTMKGEVFRLKEGEKMMALNDLLGENKEICPSIMDFHYSAKENTLCLLYRDIYFRCIDLGHPNEYQEFTYEVLDANSNYGVKTSKNIGTISKCLKSFGQQEDSDTFWIQSCSGLLGWSKNGPNYELRLYFSGRGYTLAAKESNVWIGRTKGLFKYTNGKLDSLKNLKEEYPVLDKNIKRLGIDSQDNLWIGTEGYGVFRLKGQKLDTIKALKNTIVKDLFVDEKDEVWIASNQGLYQIQKDYNVRQYTTAEGLGSNEVNCVYADTSKIYIGTNQGLTIIERNPPSQNNKPPLFHIKSLLIRGEEQEISPNKKHYDFDLNYNQNGIKIDYVCLSYESNQNIVYEYKLSGIEDEWKQTKQLSKEYPILPYGASYTLQLRAKDINQQYSDDIYTLVFNIKSPWWQTWWFRLLILGIIGGLIYNRVHFFKKKEKEKIAINKRFAELELQALQSQMNPHFIFNALQAIQDFVVGKDERAANKYMANFAKLMRLYLESSKEKYIPLEEELKLLKLYMELEQLRFDPPFNYQIDCPDSIDWGAVEIPSMLLQPFVENSINHGLKYKKGQGFVKIEIREDNNLLIIRIIDSGVGIEKAKKIKQKATKSYKSRGMKITEERLKTIQFVDGVKIDIEVQDRLIEEQVKGTIVEIKCPFFEKI